MEQEEFQRLSVAYINGKLELSELILELEQKINFKVEKVPLPVGERVMLITNHPRGENGMKLPAVRAGIAVAFQIFGFLFCGK